MILNHKVVSLSLDCFSVLVPVLTQVLDGGYNDIILRLLTPWNTDDSESDMRSKQSSITHFGGDAGQYGFCVDNRFSVLTPKKVFLSIHVRPT